MRRSLSILALVLALALTGCASAPLRPVTPAPAPVVTPEPLPTPVPPPSTPPPSPTPEPGFRYAAEAPLEKERLALLTEALGEEPEFLPFPAAAYADLSLWPEAELYLIAPEDFSLLRLGVSRGQLRTLPRVLYRRLGLWDDLLDEYLPAWGNGSSELLALPAVWWGERRSYSTGIFYFRGDWEDALFPEGELEVTWTVFLRRLRAYQQANPAGAEKPYALSCSGWELQELLAADFGVREWVLEDGLWVPGVMSGRMKESFGWLRQLYREGLLPADFFRRTPGEAAAAYAAGEAGMLLTRDPAGLYAALGITEASEVVSTWPLPITPYERRYACGAEPRTVAVFSARLTDEALLRVLRGLRYGGGELPPAGEAVIQYEATLEEDYAAFDWHSPLFTEILPREELASAEGSLAAAWESERLTLLVAGNFEEAWQAWLEKAGALPGTSAAAETVNAWADLLLIQREE